MVLFIQKTYSMKRIIITSTFLLFTFIVLAQKNETEMLIKQLDQRNAYVVAHADTVGLIKLMAKNFTINRTTGNITSGREKILQLMRGGMVAYDSFSVQTEFVLLQDPSLAISMGNEVTVSAGNRELKGQVVKRRFTHVWIKDNGEWRLLARHANNLCKE